MPRTHSSQHPSCGPGWDLFQKLSGTVSIELSQKAVPFGKQLSWMVRAEKNATVKGIHFDPQVYQRGNEDEPFRDLTAGERQLVVYTAPSIRVSSYACLQPSKVIEHRAPNDEYFTLDDMIAVVQRHELETRDETEWFGGVDCHHVFYEGFHLKSGGIWQIYWGS